MSELLDKLTTGRKELDSYFTGAKLQVLDDNKHKSYYSGVTIPYIRTYVLSEQYSDEELDHLLFEKLRTDPEFQVMTCYQIGKVTFNHTKTRYSGYQFNGQEITSRNNYGLYDVTKYASQIDNYHKIEKQLKDGL